MFTCFKCWELLRVITASKLHLNLLQINWVFLHRFLCTQLFQAIVKSTKKRFQTTKTMFKHWIHVLFEHDFYLKIIKTGRRLLTWRQMTMQGCPWVSIFSWFFDVNIITFFTEWRQTEQKNKKQKKKNKQQQQHQNGVNWCVQWQQVSWNYIQCKNNDHARLFHCINICQDPRKKFEHSALRPRVQTTSSEPGKCKCMKKHVWSL